MKKYKFNVIYLNGNKESFICNNFTEAIIKAMAHAYSMGMSSDIKCVIDEKGNVIDNIEVNVKHS